MLLTDGFALNFFTFYAMIGCRVMNSCFVPCKSALQKLLSAVGVTCQMLESPIICEVLWHAVYNENCAHTTCNRDGRGHCYAQYPGKC